METRQPDNRTVVVAMSGGVDSSVAAGLLLRQGFDVHGLTLLICPDAHESARQGAPSHAEEDARLAAGQLGIPHHVVDVREEFEERVIRDFVDEYARGRTPNPCIRCNEQVKFRALLDEARSVGAGWVATGHYARVERGPAGNYLLKRALSAEKDQSYMLYRLGQAELTRAIFPLGELRKDGIRELAREMGLPNADRPDSQEICFVGRGGYREFIASRCPELARDGDAVDLEGRPVGRHQGTIGFTIGQRKGLGVAAEAPLYVVGIDARSNTVLVGPESALMARSVVVGDLSWVSGRPPDGVLAVTCKVRYNMRIVPGEIGPLPDGLWRLEFARADRAPTPGQAAVFYRGDTVLGGGTIEAVERPAHFRES